MVMTRTLIIIDTSNIFKTMWKMCMHLINRKHPIEKRSLAQVSSKSGPSLPTSGVFQYGLPPTAPPSCFFHIPTGIWPCSAPTSWRFGAPTPSPTCTTSRTPNQRSVRRGWNTRCVGLAIFSSFRTSSLRSWSTCVSSQMTHRMFNGQCPYNLILLAPIFKTQGLIFVFFPPPALVALATQTHPELASPFRCFVLVMSHKAWILHRKSPWTSLDPWQVNIFDIVRSIFYWFRPTNIHLTKGSSESNQNSDIKKTQIMNMLRTDCETVCFLSAFFRP